MKQRDWTFIKVPDAEIIWVSNYYIAIDEILGVPIWKHSEPAKQAIARGVIREITREEAQELNVKAAASYPSNAEYLQEQLDARWRVIADQTKRHAA